MTPQFKFRRKPGIHHLRGDVSNPAGVRYELVVDGELPSTRFPGMFAFYTIIPTNGCIRCGEPTSAAEGRCTNGCCAACHRLCGPGGATSPGHALPRDIAVDASRNWIEWTIQARSPGGRRHQTTRSELEATTAILKWARRIWRERTKERAEEQDRRDAAKADAIDRAEFAREVSKRFRAAGLTPKGIDGIPIRDRQQIRKGLRTFFVEAFSDEAQQYRVWSARIEADASDTAILEARQQMVEAGRLTSGEVAILRATPVTRK